MRTEYQEAMVIANSLANDAISRGNRKEARRIIAETLAAFSPAGRYQRRSGCDCYDPPKPDPTAEKLLAAVEELTQEVRAVREVRESAQERAQERQPQPREPQTLPPSIAERTVAAPRPSTWAASAAYPDV